MEPQKLVEAKQEQDLTISLCLPTLNEEETIGKEVVLFQSELVKRYPLLDEIAVIDSGSEDNTLEVAQNFGADVYTADEILPEIESKKEKVKIFGKPSISLKATLLCMWMQTSAIFIPGLCTAWLRPLFTGRKYNM